MPELGIYISKVLKGILGDEKPEELTEQEFAELLLNEGLEELKAEADKRHGTPNEDAQ